MQTPKKKRRPTMSHQLSGRLGGLARARNLSAKERSEGARKAGLATWAKIRRGEFLVKDTANDDPAE